MLAREGARVAVTDINEEGAIRVVRALNGLRKDQRSPFPRRDARGSMAARGRGNGAAIRRPSRARQQCRHRADQDFETITSRNGGASPIDLDGVFLGCKLAIPLIARTVKASGLGGSIVYIVDLRHHRGHNMAAYNSAKAAVRHLSKSVALHCAKRGYGIRSNSVHPVFIATPILDGLVDRLGRDEAYAKLGRQVPLGHIGEPDDIAYAVLYLASDESKFVTGAD